MRFKRSSGILLHPTSLPGPYGNGELGPQAYRWVDFIAEAGFGLWQVLPLGHTGYADSPYQCFSAFAGNPYLISLETLLAEGILLPEDVADKPEFPDEKVDYGAIYFWKFKVLDRAYERFQQAASPALRAELAQFEIKHADWLPDFALFMALKDAHQGAPWHTWAPSLRSRQPAALETARQKYADSIQKQIFRQFYFFRHWLKLRQYVHSKGIKIVGDIPIFVAHDSADVWQHPELFFLDIAGKPTVQAGVPPDYFSPTGQLWGNPLYRWDVHKQSGYAWWIKRMSAVLDLVDIIRLDHFRGFAGYWEVPGKALTAAKGRWVPGPGADFFNALNAALGNLPIIAEDLGDISPDVFELRDQFELPGMKVILFGFMGNPSDTFLPHNYPPNMVVYTGTHDNDTVLGWYKRVDESEREFFRRYMHRDGSDVSWDLIRAVWMSVCVFALAPMQDFLGLDNTARMNYPGQPSGNWTWRMRADALTPALQKRMREINYVYDRLNKA
jgi:4-alpha-glucanotransferase